ncbi:ORF6N domain-containing protein [Crocinitomicaceae bacterium CZZ-1]|uniref:ORF6N domain-containing protein n=1 Tax=Taishania pollutisoli TaxID=2766479 RepID=A0A8J6P8U0_9FLAO|nr:ORF6N domain-containing protein [Taishania pollutisoli]MBC9812256.1 ORF6N domain-containing protein [Taishania pollutisoli]
MNLQEIQNRIVEIRGLNIMLDFDLAALYEVENRTLKQAVRRNRDRFPADFMFELTEEEVDLLVSQNVIPSKSYLGGAVPFAFTEQGVAMLSSVLRSKKAIHMNIAIMRVFVLIRQYTLSYTDLTNQLKALEIRYHQQFSDVYEAINYLIQKNKQQTKQGERKRIGF